MHYRKLVGGGGQKGRAVSGEILHREVHEGGHRVVVERCAGIKLYIVNVVLTIIFIIEKVVVPVTRRMTKNKDDSRAMRTRTSARRIRTGSSTTIERPLGNGSSASGITTVATK